MGAVKSEWADNSCCYWPKLNIVATCTDKLCALVSMETEKERKSTCISTCTCACSAYGCSEVRVGREFLWLLTWGSIVVSCMVTCEVNGFYLVWSAWYNIWWVIAHEGQLVDFISLLWYFVPTNRAFGPISIYRGQLQWLFSSFFTTYLNDIMGLRVQIPHLTEWTTR